MNNKVNVECPQCGYVVTLNLADLAPGMWVECPNCARKIRITNRDLRHLVESLKKRP